MVVTKGGMEPAPDRGTQPSHHVHWATSGPKEPVIDGQGRLAALARFEVDSPDLSDLFASDEERDRAVGALHASTKPQLVDRILSLMVELKRTRDEADNLQGTITTALESLRQVTYDMGNA
jgi:hypothetical protein